MTNTELKRLVLLYQQIRKESEALTQDYEENDVKLRVFTKAMELATEKLKGSSFPDTRILEGIYNECLYEDANAATENKRAATGKLGSAEIQRQIKYCEIKLDAIMQLLGPDNLKRLEDYEREDILKNE